ncbi:MAG: transposase [Cyanobacterium sp. T60_A2020_053]|nr:transposase [Cyanobacterium sp. T60_A2020_053]
MKNKAELSGCQIIDVTEEFTSKTCTKCGHVHSKLGGAKVFKCPECGHRILRDYNGALGIMLKVLSDTTFTISFDGDAIVATGIYRIVPHKCIRDIIRASIFWQVGHGEIATLINLYKKQVQSVLV